MMIRFNIIKRVIYVGVAGCEAKNNMRVYSAHSDIGVLRGWQHGAAGLAAWHCGPVRGWQHGAAMMELWGLNCVAGSMHCAAGSMALRSWQHGTERLAACPAGLAAWNCGLAECTAVVYKGSR